MKLARSFLPIFGSVAVAGLLAGCGASGPEAVPSGTAPVITEDVPAVEGLEARPKKGAKEAPGPMPHP
jgi:hypothetical protein